jgi:cytochrome c2
MLEFRRLFVVSAAILAPALCLAGTRPDVGHGKTTFDAMCGVCHSVQETGGPTQGPNLLGILGRKAGADPEFPLYSTALKDSGLKWNKKTLDKFLLNPGEKVPGTVMPMLIADKKARTDVVAYLATLKKPRKNKKK